MSLLSTNTANQFQLHNILASNLPLKHTSTHTSVLCTQTAKKAYTQTCERWIFKFNWANLDKPEPKHSTFCVIIKPRLAPWSEWNASLTFRRVASGDCGCWTSLYPFSVISHFSLVIACYRPLAAVCLDEMTTKATGSKVKHRANEHGKQM